MTDTPLIFDFYDWCLDMLVALPFAVLVFVAWMRPSRTYDRVRVPIVHAVRLRIVEEHHAGPPTPCELCTEPCTTRVVVRLHDAVTRVCASCADTLAPAGRVA